MNRFLASACTAILVLTTQGGHADALQTAADNALLVKSGASEEQAPHPVTRVHRSGGNKSTTVDYYGYCSAIFTDTFRRQMRHILNTDEVTCPDRSSRVRYTTFDGITFHGIMEFDPNINSYVHREGTLVGPGFNYRGEFFPKISPQFNNTSLGVMRRLDSEGAEKSIQRGRRVSTSIPDRNYLAEGSHSEVGEYFAIGNFDRCGGLNKGVIYYFDGRIVEGYFYRGRPVRVRETHPDGETVWRRSKVWFTPKCQTTPKVEEQWVISGAPGSQTYELTVFDRSSSTLKELKATLHSDSRDSREIVAVTVSDKRLDTARVFSDLVLPFDSVDSEIVPAVRLKNAAMLTSSSTLHSETSKSRWELRPRPAVLDAEQWPEVVFWRDSVWIDGKFAGAETDFWFKYTGPLDDQGRPNGIGQQPLFRVVEDRAKSGDGRRYWTVEPVPGSSETVEYRNGRALAPTSAMRALNEAESRNDRVFDELRDELEREMINRERAELAQERAEEDRIRQQEAARRRRQDLRIAELRDRRSSDFAELERRISENPFLERTQAIAAVTSARIDAIQEGEQNTTGAESEWASQQDQLDMKDPTSRSESTTSSRPRWSGNAGASTPPAVADAPEVYQIDGRAVAVADCSQVLEVRRGKLALGTGLHDGIRDMQDMKLFVQNLCDRPIYVGACFTMSNGDLERDSRILQPQVTRTLTEIVQYDLERSASGDSTAYNGREPVSYELFTWAPKSSPPAQMDSCE